MYIVNLSSLHYLFLLPPATANELFSAAAVASRLSNVVKYRPKNLVMVLAPPPDRPGTLRDVVVLEGVLLPPSTWPLDVNAALDLAGALAASAQAFEIALFNDEASAPLMVSTTFEFLMIRNVGILEAVRRRIESTVA